ncbi:hypothetical protein Mal4_45050 [Maioricimonas rarisocia]|uniref:Uncharacterized protein n=1 Tax=Maioricimonas rarisocia TaxID=2528026 RepID=A0A517ZCH9_9PLAN|nr:hypothetical protein [Maioricimonas rarisocia]QDU40150.1 hypothetical protein Mal4_45050 [Maioricimonas rarisocia]
MQTSQRFPDRRTPSRPERAGVALYSTVMATALLVSVLGLAGLTVVRIERQQAQGADQLLLARQKARSALELGLHAINNDPNWRTSYTSGVETTPLSLGTGSTGTISWILEDSDGSLGTPDTALRIKGVGRANGSVQVMSVLLSTSGAEGGEQIWLDPVYTDGAGVTLEAGLGIGLSFVPPLPPEATSWSITRIQFWGNGFRAGSFDARVMVREVTGLPGSLVDSVNVLNSELTKANDWNEILFPAAIGLSPASGACVVFVHASGGKCARVKHEDLPNMSPETRLTTTDGGVTWIQDQNDMWIKVWGTYTTGNSMELQQGTWLWEAAP